MTGKQKEVIKLQLALYKKGIIDDDEFMSVLEAIMDRQPEITYIPSYPWWSYPTYEQNPQTPPYQVTSTTKVE